MEYSKFELIEGDIRSYHIVRQAVDKTDVILHQAALPSVPRSVNDPITTHEVNATGTLNILDAAKDAIAKGSFSIIESLTEPPEGDMTYDKCREAWPDKVFWANISAESSKKDGEELKNEICSMIERGGKKGFLLEFAEHIPENGDDKVNVILEALGL